MECLILLLIRMTEFDLVHDGGEMMMETAICKHITLVSPGGI